MTLAITPVYAALLTALYLALSAHVIRGRIGGRVSLGDGGDEGLRARVRAHGNFAEYVPLALILMMLAEGRVPALVIHAAGLTLLAGRICHAAVILRHAPFGLRTAGMALTFASLAIGAVACLPVWG